MRKFLIVFKKELKDLFTFQSIIPIIILCVMFYFMGDLISNITHEEPVVIEDENILETQSGETAGENVVYSSQVIAIMDKDNSETSKYLLEGLGKRGYHLIIKPSDADPETALAELAEDEKQTENLDLGGLFIIPQGFENSIKSQEQKPFPIDVYTSITSFGIMSASSGSQQAGIVSVMNSIISELLFRQYSANPEININYVQYPIYENDHTYMNGVSAPINPGAIIGYIMSQNMLIPLIVYFIIMFTTQIIATSVVNEKSDKTLETLMTTPVNRVSVLLAKILAAAIYAVVCAVIYMFAFKNYFSGINGSQAYSPEMLETFEKFGISFNLNTILIIGVQLFLSVLCGLSVALILGIMVDDIKSLQSYLMPVMIVIIIPYILSIFTDLNTLTPILKVLIYLIPFTHTFNAAVNIFSQNYLLIIIGIIYQLLFVFITLTAAIKIFNSDKLITLSEMLRSRKPSKKSLSWFKK